MSTQRTKLSPGRILAIVIAVIVLVPILFIVIGFWPGSTRGIEAVANKFQPGEGWVLESEQINPPMLICLQGDCNTMSRSWSLDKNITTEEFHNAVVSSPGFAKLWRDDIKCETSPNVTGGSTMCEVKGFVDDVPITLFALGDEEDTYDPKIILRIDRRH